MKKHIRWIPVLLSLFLIFGLTLQNGVDSKQLTENTQIALSQVVNNTITKDYRMMRKYGHFLEYVPLGLSTCFAYRGKRCGVKAFLFCASISLIDQILKGFLPGREFDISDMPFDYTGFIVGISVMLVLLKICNAKRQS